MSQHKEEFRLIIAGSRYFNNYPLLRKWADHMLSEKSKTHEIVIISGTAKGADTLGEQYAKERGYRVLRFRPDWDLHGKFAGPKRNKKMADNANAVLAFATTTSRGTRSMVSIATQQHIPCKVITISRADERPH